MQDTYDELEVIEETEETVAEAAAEDVSEETIEETEEIEIEDDKRDLEGLYEALDRLTDFVSDRFDKISSLLIDAGAVIQDNVDEAYERADHLEDSMEDRLEDLDYSI